MKLNYSLRDQIHAELKRLVPTAALLTNDISYKITGCTGLSPRQRSMAISQELRRMEKEGIVKRLDALTPIAWMLVEKNK
jgi:hypothetical protein